MSETMAETVAETMDETMSANSKPAASRPYTLSPRSSAIAIRRNAYVTTGCSSALSSPTTFQEEDE
jgi:hypothetical protein